MVGIVNAIKNVKRLAVTDMRIEPVLGRQRRFRRDLSKNPAGPAVMIGDFLPTTKLAAARQETIVTVVDEGGSEYQQGEEEVGWGVKRKT